MQFVGTPYYWGGETPLPGGGYDCSGFVQELLASVGVDIPGDQTAQQLYNHFATHGRKQQTAGALAFYGPYASKIRHVGFCIDHYRQISSTGGGPQVMTLRDAIKFKAFVKIRPIDYRADFLVCLKPDYSTIGLF